MYDNRVLHAVRARTHMCTRTRPPPHTPTCTRFLIPHIYSMVVSYLLGLAFLVVVTVVVLDRVRLVDLVHVRDLTCEPLVARTPLRVDLGAHREVLPDGLRGCCGRRGLCPEDRSWWCGVWFGGDHREGREGTGFGAKRERVGRARCIMCVERVSLLSFALSQVGWGAEGGEWRSAGRERRHARVESNNLTQRCRGAQLW